MVCVSSVLDVAVKTVKEIVRQPRNLAIVLGLPVVFMLIFGLAFGSSTTTTYKVAVWNEDAGPIGATFVTNLANLTYEDGKPLVRVTNVTSVDDARALLKARDADVFVHIPSNFTADMTPPTVAPNNPGPVPAVGQPPSGARAPPKGAVVDILMDPGSPTSNGAAQVVDGYTEAFSQKASGQPAAVTQHRETVTSASLTGFDFIAPGLMVYAVMLIAPQAASVLARETELKTIDRLRLSPARAQTILGGVALAELFMASVSMALMLLTARLLGFHNQGTYAAAYIIAVLVALSVVGLGMLIASFAKTQQEAANMGVMITVPAAFLSGAFFAVPGLTLGTFAGKTLTLYHLLPTTWAVEAMRQVLTFGGTLSNVALDLAAIAALGLVYFGLGVVLFRRSRLRPE